MLNLLLSTAKSKNSRKSKKYAKKTYELQKKQQKQEIKEEKSQEQDEALVLASEMLSQIAEKAKSRGRFVWYNVEDIKEYTIGINKNVVHEMEYDMKFGLCIFIKDTKTNEVIYFYPVQHHQNQYVYLIKRKIGLQPLLEDIKEEVEEYYKSKA